VNAVRESLQKEEVEIRAHTQKREDRKKRALDSTDEEKIYCSVFGSSFIKYLNVNYVKSAGKCICPGKSLITIP
jgi:hypothetical protein